MNPDYYPPVPTYGMTAYMPQYSDKYPQYPDKYPQYLEKYPGAKIIQIPVVDDDVQIFVKTRDDDRHHHHHRRNPDRDLDDGDDLPRRGKRERIRKRLRELIRDLERDELEILRELLRDLLDLKRANTDLFAIEV